eukprot:7368616-Pyramimonas_sp.AAC.1
MGSLRRGNQSVSDPISVPRQDTAFASGQHRVFINGRVLRGAPGNVDWGRKVEKPSEDLVQFLEWADRNFTRKEDGQVVGVSGPKVSNGKALPSS